MSNTPKLTPAKRAVLYGKAWRIALCGPIDSGDEIDMEPHRVQYRLEKAWRDGYAAAKKDERESIREERKQAMRNTSQFRGIFS